jgi:hypothetical protein
MNKQQIHTRLQQLTGGLRSVAGAEPEQLVRLQRSLAEQLTTNSEFTVFGNRLHHEGAQHLETVTVEEEFSHLDQLFERSVHAVDPSVAPLVFRRETEFRSNMLGNSVPVWGSGLAVTESYGPFIDENGLHVWFDFYRPKRLVRVRLKGSSAPVLLIPLTGHVSARKTYNIQAGSVWIASKLIAADPSLEGYYTGLKVSGGTLELSNDSEVDGEEIVIKLGVNATLKLELKQNTVSTTSPAAGFDATKAIVNLPKRCTLKFSTAGGKLNGDHASSTLFGCETEFKFANGAPVWFAGIGHILVPYTVTSTESSADVFAIHSSKSRLSRFSGSAKIKDGSGWLLPAAKVDPAQLGEAAGVGALCIALREGISANWKGLKGSKTKLVLPAVMAEPGMLTVADFFARNLNGKQKWSLWRNSKATHHSEITLSFGKAFPFIFVSAATGSEAIYYFCQHKASLDRPIDANGSPFKIESSIALASIIQSGKSFRAILLDNDLLFDGDFQKQDAFKRCSVILRNALFNVSRPYSLFLYGTLQGDEKITKGTLALQFGIHLYLPTLPDPYVASYTMFLRDPAAVEFGNVTMALAAFVKWPNPDEARDREDAYVFFKFSPLDQSLLLGTAAAEAASFETDEAPARPATNDFRVGVRTFNRNVVSDVAITRARLPFLNTEQALRSDATTYADTGYRERMHRAFESGAIKAAVEELEANPLLNHIANKADVVSEVLRVGLAHAEGTQNEARSEAGNSVPAAGSHWPETFLTRYRRGLQVLPDFFRLLDVSSNADQMGVGFGGTFRVESDERGDTKLVSVGGRMMSAYGSGPTMPLQISNMDVLAIANQLRALTLPQISWEPIFNIPLAIQGSSALDDTITTTPGLLVYDNDGQPTRIFSESPYLVPITPKSVTKHFLKEFDDKDNPRNLLSFFTLPFQMVAIASFEKEGAHRSSLSFHRPRFAELRGGLQIKTVALTTFSPQETNSFPGVTYQLDGNIRSFLLGSKVTGSTLGHAVQTIFNDVMSMNQKKVPLEKIEFSGYGASIFSNWIDKAAAVADVSQTRFDVLMGRTAHEVVQVRSVVYMETGIVHVVRTITLMRSANGYVFRSDSGWQPESDAFFDCNYRIDFGDLEPKEVNNTYTYHPGAVIGVSNVREIMDYPDGGPFFGSFSLNQSGLKTTAGPDPTVHGKNLAAWQAKVFNSLTSFDEQLPVELQAVVFDGDVHFNNVASGGAPGRSASEFRVQSRKMLGYVQLRPSSVLIPPKMLAELLRFQNGSLGGPIDCIIDVAKSKQRMRLVRADLSPAPDGSGGYVFAAAARGSLLLPKDGAWSVVKHQTDTGDVKPVEAGQSVPLIRANGAPTFKIGDPGDVVTPVSKTNYGVLQSTGTQKLLFDTPQFAPNVQKLKSAETYFADAYKLLNAKSVFPNIKNAMALGVNEKEVEILGEGLMRMTQRTLKFDDLLPQNYEYAFVNEPGILKIYVDYKQLKGKPRGDLALGIDSQVADLTKRWAAAVSNIRVVVDLGPFKELMWVNGDFNASSGVNPKYDKPELQFGTMLDTVKDILRVLAMLSGDDFDNGMDVGMTNSPGSWEYKFHCSQEIPVIKFPSPELLLANPNPPLKLEAGLIVGFYFNEKISIATDLKQLVPACGAYVDFYGRIQVMCFTLGAASIYAVGQVNLGIAADTKAGISLRMKFGFGVEIVVGLPVVGNASVLYMMSIEVGIATKKVTVGAFMLFRGHAEICGGLVGVTIQIEAGGSVTRQLDNDRTECIAQVTFGIDICILWIIDISFSETWQESRQIS